jgi:hypothetical protein
VYKRQVTLPSAKKENVKMNSEALDSEEAKQTGDSVVLKLGSGAYSFTYKL